MVCKEYILIFRLIFYVLYSFTRTFSTFNFFFYRGLLFTHTVVQRESCSYDQSRSCSTQLPHTGCSGYIGRAQATSMNGREFES